jgi:integrase
VNNQKTEDLTPEQLETLLKVIDEEPNKQASNIMKTALFTGMRRGELFRLKWDDIDFERGFIHIREPKGGIDQKIPLNESARQVLEAHEWTGSETHFLAGVDASELTCIPFKNCSPIPYINHLNVGMKENTMSCRGWNT